MRQKQKAQSIILALIGLIFWGWLVMVGLKDMFGLKTEKDLIHEKAMSHMDSAVDSSGFTPCQ